MASDSGNEVGSFLSGLLIGGLIGAGMALLYAPQSGEQTRQQIADKSIELRDQAESELTKLQEQAQATVNDVQARVNQLAADAQEQVEKARAQLESTVGSNNSTETEEVVS